MWPWPFKRSKVMWWTDIDNGTLFGFLDPEINHILDILITSVALIHPEITSIDHLGHATLTSYGFQGHVMVRHYWFYFIWIPWPWKPYPWHSDHLCSINTSWDNVDQSFRSCDLDQLWFPRSRDSQTLFIWFYLDSLTLKTISSTFWSPL